MTRSEMADAVPCDGGWLAGGRRASRGELAGRWLAESRRMLRRGQRNGAQRDGGCCAGDRQVLRRTTADGLRGSPDVVPCVADGLWRVGGWRAEGRRMVREGPASCQQKALGGYI